jgi:hypothetical protein
MSGMYSYSLPFFQITILEGPGHAKIKWLRKYFIKCENFISIV